MEENIEDIIEIKVTIIGSPGVGKTCIIKNYVNGAFEEFNTSTSGVDYYKKVEYMDNKKIILNIWDTAGQEKFYSMAQYFYRNSFIIIIVYDVTNIKSFEDIKKHWMKDIMEKGEKYKIIAIVGNKIDLYDNEGVNEIDDKIVKEFLDNINKNNKNCKFISERVSAKKNINIKVLFDKLLKEYFNEEFNQKVKQKILEDGVSFKVKKKKKARKEDGNCC
jgi:small GTP-binding protein